MRHVTRNNNRSRRSRTKNRRASRVRIGLVLACALGVFPAGVAVFHEVKPRTSAQDGAAVADESLIFNRPRLPVADPGDAKSYEPGINVSTRSTANAGTRNATTTIPLASWTGDGADLSMTVARNAGAGGSLLDLVGPSNDELSPGWSLSFGSHGIWDSVEDTSTGTHEDGRQTVYTSTDTSWKSPVGVYDFLTGGFYDVKDFVLANQDQSSRRYNCIDGRLMAIADGLGNEINACMGLPSRPRWITDAAGRQLNRGANPASAWLDRIINPRGIGETTIETPGVLAFPCRCKRRPPRRDSKAIRLARRSCPMK